MMVGTIIGEMSKPMTTAFIRKSVRVNPSAANVPSRVAKIVVEVATMRLVPSASRQASEATSFSYHWVDSPGIGKVKYGSALNDNGMMAKVGANRNNNIKPHMTQRMYSQARSIKKKSKLILLIHESHPAMSARYGMGWVRAAL